MSSHARVSTVAINIDRYMSRDLGLGESITDDERKLFDEFQSLNEHEDYIFLWSCAQSVADGMALEDPGVVLTQYGVTESLYFNGVNINESYEMVVRQRIMSLNREFLKRWALKRVEMEAQREKINSLTQETRDLLDKNVYAVEAIRRVVQMLIEDGFSPTDPNVVNTPVSVAFSKGVHIHAENNLKEVREVWLFLPGGKTKIHVNTKNPLDCTQTARDVAIKVADVLKGIGAASIPIITHLEGVILDGSEGKRDGRKEEALANARHSSESAKSK